MPEYQYKNVHSDVKIIDDKEGIVDAYVSTTNIVDHGKDNILPGAYAKTLRERVPKVCWAHAWEHPIGKSLKAVELLPGNKALTQRHQSLKAGALWTRSKLNLKVQAGRDALEWLKFWTEENPEDPAFQTKAEWSIGYDCSGTNDKGEQKSYRDKASGVRYIKALDLFEYSPVAHGMAPLTDTIAIKDLPRPIRIITQAAKAMQNGTLSPLAELSLDELAGAVDLKDYSRKAVKPDDVDAVHKHSAEIEAEPEPDNRSGETAKAGGDGTTKIEEDSYDDGTPQKPAKPGWEDEDDDDGRTGGGREDVDAEDKSRHSVQTWVNMFGGKDWATWDQEHPESAAGDEEPGEEEQKPSSGAPKPSSGAPKPASGAPKPSSGAPKSPAGGTADHVDDTAPKPDEGENNGKQPEKEGELAKIGEAIHHVVETGVDIVREGRERGDRWAEQWSSASSSNQGKTIRTIGLGSHEETKAATDQSALTAQTHQDEIDEERDEQHTEESGRETPPVEKAFAGWKLGRKEQERDENGRFAGSTAELGAHLAADHTHSQSMASNTNRELLEKMHADAHKGSPGKYDNPHTHGPDGQINHTGADTMTIRASGRVGAATVGRALDEAERQGYEVVGVRGKPGLGGRVRGAFGRLGGKKGDVIFQHKSNKPTKDWAQWNAEHQGSGSKPSGPVRGSGSGGKITGADLAEHVGHQMSFKVPGEADHVGTLKGTGFDDSGHEHAVIEGDKGTEKLPLSWIAGASRQEKSIRKPNIPLPTDSDGYVEDEDGIAGDASRRVDAPQDAALPVELSKRGIPDEDGRTDASAMKTRFQSKRDFDANVGGGVDRDKLSAGDFVFPKTRTFPIVTAGDVSDAVSSWGRYKGSESFDTFKARLTSIAKRKGFAGSLPDEWKAGGEKVYDDSVSTKAWVNLEGSYEDVKADLSEAVDRMIDTVFPDMDVTSWVAATYPTKAIVGVLHNGGPGDVQPEYWEVPYNIDNKDIVTLSNPKALDVVAVAVDRYQSDNVFNFVPATAVAARGLQEKNATRLWRRYSLLANAGVDITQGHPGLTPALLRMAPEGLSYIPGEGDSDFRTGQMDMSQPGDAEPNIPDNSPMARGNSYDSGNMSAPPLPSFYQGTYYVDNAGNLSAAPVASDINSGVGMRPGPVDSSLYSGHHYGDQVPPAMNGILGTTLDAGTLSYRGMTPGESKNESRILRHRRLLDLFNARVPDADEPLSDSTETEEKLLGLVTTISEAFTEVKEGRMLSAANAGHLSDAHEAMGHMLAGHAKLAEAHSAMGELLRQAGVEPSVFEPQNEEGGKDEEGVPIEPVEAKSFLEDIAQWKALQEGTTV